MCKSYGKVAFQTLLFRTQTFCFRLCNCLKRNDPLISKIFVPGLDRSEGVATRFQGVRDSESRHDSSRF